MLLSFTKYQGTGNDFILIDNRKGDFPDDRIPLIQQLTDRKYGIGADGLIVVEKSSIADFNMIYYNADGSQSLCGNGSRCAVDFARSISMFQKEGFFEAVDGKHLAKINAGTIQIAIHDVHNIEVGDDYFFINNGSPHHIEFVEGLDDLDVISAGSKIRNSRKYQPAGTNVNFIEITGHNQLKVRTFERGVENETLSCGTGVVASAIAASFHGLTSPVEAITPGGKLKISFDREAENYFKNVYLAGPVKRVFEGQIEI